MSSAVSFCLMSIVKNAAIVSISILAFGDTFKPLQIILFAISLVLIALHGFMKMYKADFDNGYIAGLRAMFNDTTDYFGLTAKTDRYDEEAPALADEEQKLVSPKLLSEVSKELTKSEVSKSSQRLTQAN